MPDHGLDAAGNVDTVDDWIISANSHNYDYDSLNRLTADSGGAGTTLSYSYDANGNRLARTATGGTPINQVFTYTAASNRISTYQQAGGSAQTVQYDGMGNVQNNSVNGLSFEQDVGDGRLRLIFQAGINTGLTLLYNGSGELARTRKVTYAACTQNEILLAQEYFTFSPDGRALSLVSENQGPVQYEYVWLD